MNTEQWLIHVDRRLCCIKTKLINRVYIILRLLCIQRWNSLADIIFPKNAKEKQNFSVGYRSSVIFSFVI